MSVGPDLARQAAWRRRLREFERSLQTVGEFCDRAGVSVSTFYRWQRKLARRSTGEERPAATREAKAPRVTPPPMTLPPAARARATSSPAAGPAMSFLPIEITTATHLEAILPNGAWVSAPCHDHEVIRTILAALASLPREDRGC